MILVCIAVAWGPLFIAEWVRHARPDLNASYGPQGFAMAWMFITLWFSILAAALILVHVLRWVVSELR